MALSITNDCKLIRVDEDLLSHCDAFTCGASDLDEFLYKDSMAYENDLMGKTYCWLLEEDNTKVVGFVTLANAGIQTTHLQNHSKRHLNKNIPYSKEGRSYPAVLTGRIAVSKVYQGGFPYWHTDDGLHQKVVHGLR